MSETGYFEGYVPDARGRRLRFVARYEVDEAVEVFWRARVYDVDGTPLGDRHGAFIAVSAESDVVCGRIAERLGRTVARDSPAVATTTVHVTTPPRTTGARAPRDDGGRRPFVAR